MRIPLFLLFFTGIVLIDALENIILGRTFEMNGTNLRGLTDGLRNESCITVNHSTVLDIIFDLRSEYSFESISVYFKESNTSYVEIRDGIYSTYRQYTDKIPSDVVFRGQRESNSIKVYISSVGPFTVCEVEAMGCQKGHYGENCTVCDFPANCQVCDVTDGSCYRCHSNFTGPSCLQDIPNDENITLSIYAYDLGFGVYDSSGTFNLSSDEVYKIPFARNTYAIYMTISITYPDTPLSGIVYMCELEMKGCLSGYYGTPCTRCNHSGCAAENCHPLDGSCVCESNNYDVTTCPEGYLCKFGWFGKYCDQRCSSRCNVSYECYQGNGTCIGGCADGWTSDRCDQGDVL